MYQIMENQEIKLVTSEEVTEGIEKDLNLKKHQVAIS